MVKTTKNLTNGLNHIQLNPKLFKPTELSLVLVRMKELDREFARQTKQLTALTKRLSRKVGERFITPREK